LERPFEAYRGDAPYVFICYAHDDQAVVYPEITWLHEQGVNVWYDEGISPGEEWSEELGRAIDGAERFVYFVSPRSVASRHCRNELNFAQNHDKSILSVYLEETELPSGIELVIGASQALMKANFAKADYRARLLRSLAPSTESPGGPLAERRPSRIARGASVALWGAGALLLVVVSVLAAFWLLDRSPQQSDQDAHVLDRSLAVMPLTVVGGDPAAAAFTDALTEELRTVVTGYQELDIVAVAGEADPAHLDASYLLSGNVQRIGERLRLRVRLSRTHGRDTAWAQSFDQPTLGAVSDAPELARVVGRLIRKEIVVDQECEPVRQTARSKEAADAYCAAVTESYRGATGGESDARMALSQAQRAVELDPDIAGAHVFVGLNYCWLGEGDQLAWREAARLAREALDRSVALAPEDRFAIGLRGRIEMLEMNYPAAEASLHEAIARDPLLPRTGAVHGRLAMLASAQGNLHQALEHIRRSLRIDDSNAVQYWILGAYLNANGEHREAIQAADAGLGLVGGGSVGMGLYIVKIRAHHALGEESRANETLDQALTSGGSVGRPILAGMLAVLGRTQEARKNLVALERLEQPPTNLMAETYAQLGDDRAFDWIHSGIEQHIGLVIWLLRTNPAYAALRDDPRWAEVMAHLEAEEAKGSAGENRQG